MDDKNLDKLFQENLRDFKATPSKNVWNGIENKLDKKKRRVIPIWWYTGVAALIALGLFLFPFQNNTITPQKENITKKQEDSTTLKKDSLQNIKSINKEIYTLQEKDEDNSQQNQDASSLITKNKIESNDDFIENEDNSKKSVFASNLKMRNIQFESNKLALKFPELAKKKPTDKKIDFIKFTSKKEIETDKEEANNRWSVAPIFAVLQSNSFSDTSPIDDNLTTSTQGENSYSYGVEVAYKINKKWTIQTGIHMQEISYTNEQVSVFTAPATSASVNFINGVNYNFKSNSTELATFSGNSLSNTISSTAILNQTFGYIEIPVEVKYNFTNNEKFETNVVTGFSSLILNKNLVQLNSNNRMSEGAATNLNDFNFSGNLGFDFNYFLDKKWSIHLNPMFKVQLNTFSDNANNFAPFNMGIYSGIRYRF